MRKPPTRNDLIAALTSLQGLVGKAMGANGDRNANRAAEVNDYLQRAHDLCIEARAYDPSDAGYRGRFANLDTTSAAR